MQLEPMKNIRTAIGKNVARAIASTKEGDELNTHNWIEITTDHIINEFLQALPAPVDIASKYEMPKDGSSPSMGITNLSENEDQILHLQRFADDQGYNRYHKELIYKIKSLYKLG